MFIFCIPADCRREIRPMDVVYCVDCESADPLASHMDCKRHRLIYRHCDVCWDTHSLDGLHACLESGLSVCESCVIDSPTVYSNSSGTIHHCVKCDNIGFMYLEHQGIYCRCCGATVPDKLPLKRSKRIEKMKLVKKATSENSEYLRRQNEIKRNRSNKMKTYWKRRRQMLNKV